MIRVSTYELRRRVASPCLCEFNVFDTEAKIKAVSWVRKKMRTCIDALDRQLGTPSGFRPEITLQPIHSNYNGATAVCRATQSKEWR